MADFEIIADDNNLCGEGPIWNARTGELTWNDLGSSLVFRYNAATGEKRTISDRVMAAGIALHDSGGYVFAGSEGVCIWRGPDDITPVATHHENEKLFFNDILADPRGRVYGGCCYWGAAGMEKLGKLYLIDTDGSVRIVDDGIELANGLGLSPDNRTLYFTDSAARKIHAYDVDVATGSLSNKRTVVDVPKTEGLPDGMTVDGEGFLWSAQWFGRQVVRYDPDGRVERRLQTPMYQTSSVAFGGDDLTDLYITTAGESFETPLAPPGYDFHAPNIGGPLYRVRGDVPGKLEYVATIRT